MMRRLPVLLALLLMRPLSTPSWGSVQGDQKPASPGRGQEPFQGLKSVADRAERDWNQAHTAFRKVMSLSDNPCDSALKQSNVVAQLALKERTRAWKAFYHDR